MCSSEVMLIYAWQSAFSLTLLHNISVKQGNNHASYQICSGGFKYFKGDIYGAKLKEKFKFWPQS